MDSANITFENFPFLSNQQKGRIKALQDLYFSWNEKVNLISRKDIEHLYTRHVLHSLGIVKIITFKPGTRILDVGTGGGFPGIPLAIMFPDANFLLIDSTRKKIEAVAEIAKSLDLANVTTDWIRAEEMKGTFDFVVARAVTQLPLFLKWVEGKVSSKSFNDLPNGVLYLKGGDLKEELAEIKLKYRVFELSQYFEDPFFEEKKVVWCKA